MRSLVVLVAVFVSVAAHAQATRDANPREDQNTQGANKPPSDPATQERLRMDGAAGGTRDEKSSDREQGRGARGEIR